MNCQSWHRSFSAGLAALRLRASSRHFDMSLSGARSVKSMWPTAWASAALNSRTYCGGRFGASLAVAQRIRDFLIEGAKTVGISVSQTAALAPHAHVNETALAATGPN